MKLYTTINRINTFAPCKTGMDALYSVIGEEYPKYKEIYFSDLLKAGVDLDYIMWGLGTVLQKEYANRLSAVFACDCAERVLHIYEKQYPDDKRPREAIEATRKRSGGEVDDAARDAAWDAVRNAAGDDAWDDARRAKYAAGAAAWAARDDAMYAAGAARAASAAERKRQIERLIEYVDGKVDFMRAEGGE